MGIVVTIAMLLGLAVLRPTPWRSENSALADLRVIVFTCAILLIAGLWNFFWYGLRNIGDFWGFAALLSGAAMILSALIIFLERGDPVGLGVTWIATLRSPVVIVLTLCFLLYSVTLIQLNFGYSILG